MDWAMGAKVVGSSGLAFGMIGAYLIATTTMRVAGSAETPPVTFGDTGERRRGTISGVTGTASNSTRWRWGWSLIGAGFFLQSVAVWID